MNNPWPDLSFVGLASSEFSDFAMYNRNDMKNVVVIIERKEPNSFTVSVKRFLNVNGMEDLCIMHQFDAIHSMEIKRYALNIIEYMQKISAFRMIIGTENKLVQL